MSRFRPLAAGLLAALACICAPAQELSTSVFGTFGYAQSNRDFRFERFIDKDGTFTRDSLLGVQADVKMGPKWTATLQLKAGPSLESDEHWDVAPAWGFLAWRPDDDWLLRVGRMRLPLYLHSESMDVGNTFDMARLPQEMYGLVPSSDFFGGSVTRSWAVGSRDLALDLVGGKVATTARFWLRDGLPPEEPPGACFVSVKVDSAGGVISLKGADDTLRAGVFLLRLHRADGSPIAKSFPFVQVSPGVGYYQLDSSMPGPGVPRASSVHNVIYTVGLARQLAPGWRVEAEFARDVQRDTQLGFDSHSGYVALFHPMERFTPYVSWGLMKSGSGAIDWYENLTHTQLPPVIPGAAQINAAMRVAGEMSYASDQTSWALGTSYAIDANQKLKFEWMITHIGRLSHFADTPPGREAPHDTSVQAFSASYNFNF